MTNYAAHCNLKKTNRQLLGKYSKNISAGLNRWGFITEDQEWLLNS